MNKKIWLIGTILGISLLIILVGAVLWLPAEAQFRENIGATNQSSVDDSTTEVSWLYNTNCVACHGAKGQGSAIAPPLDNPALREADAAFLYDTIAMGRAGTAMPTWSQELGGSLSSTQIEQLVDFIKAGNWDEAELAEGEGWLNQMLFGGPGPFCEQNMAENGGIMGHRGGMMGNTWNDNWSDNWNDNSNNNSGYGRGMGMGRMGGGMGHRR